MITCKLTSREPAMVVLNVEWLSRLLVHLLVPSRPLVLDEGGGILREGRLFDKWIEEGLLPDSHACRLFLKGLGELHVMRLQHDSKRSEEVVFVPHILHEQVPGPLQEAVQNCHEEPCGGWRACALCGEETGQRCVWHSSRTLLVKLLIMIFLCSRRVVDPIVFTQLLLFLHSSCHMEVSIQCRSVGLVRVNWARARHWMLLCSTPQSIGYVVVEFEVLVLLFFRGVLALIFLCLQGAHGRVRDLSVLPFEPGHVEAITVLHTSVSIFLKHGHQQLLRQLVEEEPPFLSPTLSLEVAEKVETVIPLFTWKNTKQVSSFVSCFLFQVLEALSLHLSRGGSISGGPFFLFFTWPLFSLKRSSKEQIHTIFQSLLLLGLSKSTLRPGTMCNAPWSSSRSALSSLWKLAAS